MARLEGDDFIEATDPSLLTWVFGPTQELQYGTPPATYEQRIDGYWYPPETLTDDEIFQPEDPIIYVTRTGAGTDIYTATTPAYEQVPYRTPFKQTPISILTRINVQALPVPRSAVITTNIRVRAAVPALGIGQVEKDVSFTARPIPIKAKDGLTALIRNKLANKVETFFDVDRALKTLLNFGNDYQTLITNWQYDPTDPTRSSILAKLYRPLPTDVPLRTKLWISREIAPTVIDRLLTVFIPDAPTLLYLRPPNKRITVAGQSGHGVDNVSLETLFTSNSFDLIKPTDPVIEEWYTHDINNTELNVDYSDYRNFVFFSSAERRLTAFAQKMRNLESLTSVLDLHTTALGSNTGSAYVTGSVTYTSITTLADERLDLVRSFDGYERFLYYGSGSAYSSSLTTTDYQDELFYNVDATWPKVTGSCVSVASASTWLNTQRAIAAQYDIFNQDRLANNLPEYVQKDEASEEFLMFMDMIGHQVDSMKLYIDAMSHIYDRNSNPLEGLSQDMAWNVAEAFGIKLPNQYAVKQLVDYTIGEVGTATPKIYREAAAETWRRFLHNQIFLMKAKGTRTSLRALANAYGVLPTVLQIRESGTPGFAYLSGSYEIYDEQTNALLVNAGSYVTLPWTTGSVVPQTLEFRFSSTQAANTVLLNASNNAWAVVLSPLSASYAQIQVRNAINTTVVSSSYLPLLGGDFYSVMLRNDTTGMSLQVKRAESDDLVDESITSAASGAISFISPSAIHLGGAGAWFGLPDWTGMIDEVRVWGELLTNKTFDLHVRYPGLYNGNGNESARNFLYSRLSFNFPRNLFTTASLPNESPYARITSASVFGSFPATGFTNLVSSPWNMTVHTREVLRYAPNAGGSQFTSNKVVIADAPVMQYMTFANTSASVPVLYRDKSIVTLDAKKDFGKSTNVVAFYFSLTDAINDSIIRSIGNIDLQNLIGDPSDQYATNYSALNALSQLYWESYAYSYNTNSFIDFVRNLLGPLFEQARSLVPVRAKLLSGIVHEPHILERSKAPLKPIKMDAGVYGRRDNENVNLDAAPVYSLPALPVVALENYVTDVSLTDTQIIDAVRDNLDATVLTDDTLVVVGARSDYDTDIDTTAVLSYNAEYTDHVGTIDTNIDLLTTNGAFNQYDEVTNNIAYKNFLLSQYRVLSVVDLTAAQREQFLLLSRTYRSQNIINFTDDVFARAKDIANDYFDTASYFVSTIQPISNLDNREATEYFTHPLGYVGTTEMAYRRRRERELVDRGAWATGSVYSRNNFVSDVNETGTVLEWVAISTDQQFTSSLAPWRDYNNWKQMQYISEEVTVIKKIATVNGQVSVVSTGSVYTPIIGYHPSHYKFSRDYRTGIIRHQWLGCTQTSLTTTDGKDPVEVLFSAGDTLIVNDQGEPIQPTDPLRGPILDVQ